MKENSNLQNFLLVALVLGGVFLLAIGLRGNSKRIIIQSTPAAQAEEPALLHKPMVVEPQAQVESQKTSHLTQEQIQFLIQIETKAENNAKLAEFYEKTLTALELADKNPNFSACSSICNPVEIDLDLDADKLTPYFKRKGMAAFDNAGFVRSLVTAKINEQDISRRLMSIYVNDLNVEKLKNNPAYLAQIMAEIQSENSQPQSPEARSKRFEALSEYEALNLECEDNKIQFKQAYEICKKLADEMGVPQ